MACLWSDTFFLPFSHRSLKASLLHSSWRSTNLPVPTYIVVAFAARKASSVRSVTMGKSSILSKGLPPKGRYVRPGWEVIAASRNFFIFRSLNFHPLIYLQCRSFPALWNVCTPIQVSCTFPFSINLDCAFSCQACKPWNFLCAFLLLFLFKCSVIPTFWS